MGGRGSSSPQGRSNGFGKELNDYAKREGVTIKPVKSMFGLLVNVSYKGKEIGNFIYDANDPGRNRGALGNVILKGQWKKIIPT